MKIRAIGMLLAFTAPAAWAWAETYEAPRAVRGEAPVVVTGEDGRRAVELARRIVDAIGARPMQP